MTTDPSRKVLDRLRAIDWEDWTKGFDHARSRARLMSEYLRRAALWAQEFGAESDWPFFDIAEHVDPTIQLDAGVEAELQEFLRSGIGPKPVKETCRGATRWAALRARTRLQLPALPDPYEPLLLMYERGGGFYLEQFIELNGVAIPFRRPESILADPPFLTLAPTTLDALDAAGRTTYYAKITEGYSRNNPCGIVRRRVVGKEETHDEAFTRNLRWEPTEYLRLYELGHNDMDHVEISEVEAAAFIEKVAEKINGQRQP